MRGRCASRCSPARSTTGTNTSTSTTRPSTPGWWPASRATDGCAGGGTCPRRACTAPVALDAATGGTVWSHTGRGDASSRVVQAAGDLLVVMDEARLEGVRPADGFVPWSQPRTRPGGPARATALSRPGDRLVHVRDGNVLRALSRRTGLEMWQFEAGAAAARVLEDHGLVYTAAHLADEGRDTVFCLDAGTGQVRWQRALARRRATSCGLHLLGVRSDALYVRVAHAGRRGLLGRGRDAEPFVVALDAALADHEAVLLDDVLILARPDLTAVALP